MPRLPGPPYHFVTRVTHVAGERLSMRPGAEANEPVGSKRSAITEMLPPLVVNSAVPI